MWLLTLPGRFRARFRGIQKFHFPRSDDREPHKFVQGDESSCILGYAVFLYWLLDQRSDSADRIAFSLHEFQPLLRQLGGLSRASNLEVSRL